MKTDDHATDAPRGGALRNPMVWLIVGLPALVIVAAFVTLAIAIRSGGSDALPDDVKRTAQIQTTDLGPDAFAAAEKLSAVIRIEERAIDILPAGGELLKTDEVRKRPVRLSLQHPTRAADDRELELRPVAHGWRVDDTLDLSHDWRVQLVGADGRWRLRGRLPKATRATLLQPALESQAPAAADRTVGPSIDSSADASADPSVQSAAPARP